MGQDNAPHALIWVSGLSEATVDQSVLGIARRVAIELDRHAVTVPAHFTINPDVREETFAGSLTSQVCTIVREDAHGKRPIIDLYGLPTQSALISDYEKRGPLAKALLAALTTIRSVPKAVSVSLCSEPTRKTRREQRQLLYAQLLMLLLFVYALVNVFAIVTTFDPAASDSLRRVSQGTLVGLTLGGIWKADIVRQLSHAATETFCVMQYLDYGYRSDVLRGHITDLVEHLSEHEQTKYTTIDLMAYSFGTIAVIDALYPVEGEQTLRQLRTFVMIACPFDLISTYWRSYFTERHAVDGVPQRWINIYSPIDVLASNFQDKSGNNTGIRIHGEVGASTEPLRPESKSFGREDELSAWQALLLMGIRVHGMYWEREFENETSVFSLVAPEIYRSDEVMA